MRIRPLVMCFVMGCALSVSAEDVEDTITRFAGPEARNSGDGTTQENVALYTDVEFWERVQNELEKSPVTVQLLKGEYVNGTLKLQNMGHPENRLVIEGASDRGTAFRILSEKGQPANTGFHMTGCQNITVRNLYFTGPGHTGYISVFNGTHILVENCAWIDLPNMRYGSTGVHREKAHHITFRNCTFKRVGVTGGAHMMYNAYGSHHLYLIDCYFEDCAGDYVRFRDLVDYCVVERCTFKSTGNWPPDDPGHRAFIAIPLFADANPGDEWFGTHFVIKNNTFIYEKPDADGMQISIRFGHKGFDPPELHHLMTPEEGEILEKGTPEQKKAILKVNCNIDTNEVRVFGNTYKNVENQATFSSYAAYGAKSKGWEGRVDIFDLLNHEKGTPQWEVDFLKEFTENDSGGDTR